VSQAVFARAVAETAKGAFLAGEEVSPITITISNAALRVSFVIDISFALRVRNHLIKV
jgi:hypothetical protein